MNGILRQAQRVLSLVLRLSGFAGVAAAFFIFFPLSVVQYKDPKASLDSIRGIGDILNADRWWTSLVCAGLALAIGILFMVMGMKLLSRADRHRGW